MLFFLLGLVWTTVIPSLTLTSFVCFTYIFCIHLLFLSTTYIVYLVKKTRNKSFTQKHLRIRGENKAFNAPLKCPAETPPRTRSNSVRSGNVDNREAVAAAYYWKEIFPNIPDFVRDRNGVPPNNVLNYGYAILRGVVARALVSSGLLPTLGIHHHNRYNAYCLADDIMEPYRPIVDKLVLDILAEMDEYPTDLSTEIKAKLLNIPVLDCVIDGNRSPLMNAVSTTTASLAKCYLGTTRKLLYPEM